eukprot:Opistho-1_new@38745
MLCFLVLLALPLVYSTTEDGTPQRVELVERESEDSVMVIYPRRALVPYAAFLILTWAFRVAACICAIVDQANWGGPYLCLFAVSYFLEHAVLPFAMHYVLVADSEFLHGNAWASNAGEFVRWIDYGRTTKKGSLGGVEFAGGRENTLSQSVFGDSFAPGGGIGAHATSDFDALQINPADIIVFPEPLSPPHCQYKVFRGAWLGAPVAVKVIPLVDGMEGEETRQAILSEVRILRRLSHPNVVHFLGWCEDDLGRRLANVGGRPRAGTGGSISSRLRAVGAATGAGAGVGASAGAAEAADAVSTDGGLGGGDFEIVDECRRELWIVMELLPLTSLEILNRDPETVFAYRRLVRMFTHVCRGMAFLENKRVIHRDLKSPNIFVGRGFVLKIGDFGESTIMGTQGEPGKRLLGSWEWSAPEVLARRDYTHKSDVFAFGVIMWELVSRHMPFDHLEYADAFEYEDAIARAVAEGFRHPIPADCPQELRELIRRCWEEDPSRRPSFDEARKELERLKRTLKVDQAMWAAEEKGFLERQRPSMRRMSGGSIGAVPNDNESPDAPLLQGTAPRRVRSEYGARPHSQPRPMERNIYGTWSGPPPTGVRELRGVVDQSATSLH